jgi:hypothetical protein
MLRAEREERESKSSFRNLISIQESASLVEKLVWEFFYNMKCASVWLALLGQSVMFSLGSMPRNWLMIPPALALPVVRLN